MKKLSSARSTSILRRHPVPFAIALTLIASFGASAAPATPPATAIHDKNGLPPTSAGTQQAVINAHNAYSAGHRQLAITLLRNALKTAPKDGSLRSLLARLLLQTGDAASAERELRQAQDDGAPVHVVLPTLVRAMLLRHEEQKFLDEFPEPAAHAQGDVAADILTGRAEAYSALGRASEAAASMDRSLSIRRDVSGLLNRVRFAELDNKLALAASLTDEAVKLEPTNGHALLAKLDLLMRSKDLTGALGLSTQILKLFPDDITSRQTRIEIFLKLNQDGKAKAELDTLQAKAPNMALIVYYRAVLLARAHDFKGAWRIAQTLTPVFTQSQTTYAIQISQIAIGFGNVETGAAILAAALAKSPDDLELRLRLAAVRISQSSPEAALGVLLPVKESGDPRVLDLLAQAYLKIGKHENEAGGALDKLGYIKLQMKDSKGALDALTRAHGLRPKDGEVAFHLVQALDASGNRNAAKSELKALLDSGIGFDDLPKARQLAATWH